MIFLFSSLIIEEKTSSLVPYDENENFVTERYYSVTKFCIVTSKMSWIRVFLLVSSTLIIDETTPSSVQPAKTRLLNRRSESANLSNKSQMLSFRRPPALLRIGKRNPKRLLRRLLLLKFDGSLQSLMTMLSRDSAKKVFLLVLS
jgi:hypothetical protein